MSTDIDEKIKNYRYYVFIRDNRLFMNNQKWAGVYFLH